MMMGTILMSDRGSSDDDHSPRPADHLLHPSTGRHVNLACHLVSPLRVTILGMRLITVRQSGGKGWVAQRCTYFAGNPTSQSVRSTQ